MTTMTNTPQQQLNTLSETLALEYEEQDWGIVNADGRRLDEFVNFYVNSSISEEMRYQMFELILASVNDALNEEIQPEATITTLDSFLEIHKTDFPEQVAYWSGLTDEDEFPIAKYLLLLK